MNIRTGEWPVYDGYEIMEMSPDINKYHIEPTKFIISKKNSRFKFYDPLTFGNGIKYEGYGKKPYQPENADGEEWPPHLALARLDLANEKAILNYVSIYGLLGLYLVNDIDIFSEWGFLDYHKEACRFALDNTTVIDAEKATINAIEPLPSFVAAAKVFQSAVHLLRAINEKHSEEYDGQLWQKFSYIARPYLKKIHPIIGRDSSGLPIMAWNFINLINYCYFRLIQDVQGSTLKLCSFKKCNRLFLAKNLEDTYCSKECRHKGTMANLAIRRVKNDLREMEERGVINKAMRWLAGKKAQEWYTNGVREYESLNKKTIRFIEREKSKRGEINNG